MSQEIKNTLFRFVTMRAPELSNEENQEKRFVKRPTPITVSAFDLAVKNKPATTTKWAAMQNHASTFDALETKEDVEQTNPDLYKLGVWIAKNKYSYTNQELIAKKAIVKTNLTPEAITVLWDNLFYQVITNKNFYVKEAIMQLLIADNLIKNFVNDNTIIANLVNAKVILPKELFVEKEETTSLTAKFSSTKAIAEIKDDTPEISLPSETMQQFQAISMAELEIEKISRLKEELSNLEKTYNKEYQAAYKIAQTAHQEKIKPILTQHALAVEESKKNWCSVQNPQLPYDATNPCNQPPVVPLPDLPSFEFEYQNEIDLFNLQQNLSEESLETLNDIYDLYHLYEREGVPTDHKGDATKSSSLRTASYNTFAGFETFTDLTTNLNGIVSINNDIILNNTVNQQPSAISLGGVIIPSSNTLPSIPFIYQICPKTYNRNRRRVSFDVSFDVPDTSWQVLSVETKYLITDRDEKIVTDFTPSRTGNTIFFNSLLYNEYLYSSILLTGSLKYISLTVTFTNGAIKTFKTGTWNSTNCFFGNFVDVKGSNDTGGNIDIVNLPENTFVPTGFGVKQIGIADYKKVEQTLQGYVEGDVSHIENIMAREYKEKATRRLRRSENTTTTSSETEKEQLSDTTSANRFEMQNEVASVIQESKDFGIQASVSYEGIPKTQIFAGANFASHSSKEDSNRQAITQAKDITERAMERVVSKVKEERIQKIIEEFSEENTHGFDNRKGDQHVVGVFRWVDKVYKNQVVNYGKRLMFEFMIPEPAKLHLLGMAANKSLGTVIEPPIDPRNATAYKLSDYSFVNETTIKYWGGKFNVELPPMPALNKTIGKSFSNNTVSSGGFQDGHETFDAKENLKIPEGYFTKKADVTWGSMEDGDWRQPHGMSFIVGNLRFTNKSTPFPQPDGVSQQLKSFEEEIPLSVYYLNSLVFNANATILCERKTEYYAQWQQETFKAIINGYNDALTAYNQLLAEEKAKGDLIKGTNPGFYRQIENVVLRKNCISYLVSQNTNSKRTYGRDMLLPLGKDVTRNFGNHEINVSADLDDYAAFAKFIEQAFEWDIMSYNFYPYYWGKRTDWASLYQYDNNDPLFRSFMQSGMARVIVTVRPGFEEAVNYYMQTGQIWNGGEVPVIEDELFLSIVDELQQPVGKKEGKAWPTRIPTSLTILQADSIGLKVEKALPYDEDLSDFENPDEVPQPTGFEVTGSQLNNATTKFIQFTFEGMDGREFRTIGEHDNAAQFPRVYECMGQTITINRDAKWLKTTPSSVIFDELAGQLSLLNGVKARVAVGNDGSTDGITFTLDTSKIKDFTFKKPGEDPLYDSLRVIIEDEAIVKIGKYDYSFDGRIQDKSGVALDLPNTTNLFPISRFEI